MIPRQEDAPRHSNMDYVASLKGVKDGASFRILGAREEKLASEISAREFTALE